MDLSSFFSLSPPPPNAMSGTYNLSIVALSYFIACLASFVALDITERIRAGGESDKVRMAWLIIGAFAMGMGIWTMHFIGMLAFVMPMPMEYDPALTLLSLIIAIVASAFAFFLIKKDEVKVSFLMLGGIWLGLGIVSMHYVGMSAMTYVKIRYIPSLFFLSILIAIAASEAALWLMIRTSAHVIRFRSLLKIGSALIMGFAISGMHYMGMAAAVFVENTQDMPQEMAAPLLNPDTLSFYISAMTIAILGIALAASRFWMKTLQNKNLLLSEAEKALEKKNLELKKLNEDLLHLAEISLAREEKISAILTAAGDGIIVLDENGDIEMCNRAAAEILGQLPEEIISQNFVVFFGRLPFPSKEARKYCKIQKNNATVPIELTISQSFINNKTQYVVVFRDISERKLAEEQLAKLNDQLLTTARLAGMAEVAICVLHNVGNVLNSINISAQLLLEKENQTKYSSLIQFAKLLNTPKDSSATSTLEEEKQNLANYLTHYADYCVQEQNFKKKELQSLNEKVQHVKNIIAMQSSLSGKSSLFQKTDINELIDEALEIHREEIKKYHIHVKREYGRFPLMEMDQVKLMQVMINLIKNGIEALIENQQPQKILTIRSKLLTENTLSIEVSDNGVGISPEDLKQIFTYGFTTKKTGHGFGLHASLLSARESGGTLSVQSQGVNLGATFTLILPIRAHNVLKI
jgi:PAS domain S-box-containing protein